MSEWLAKYGIDKASPFDASSLGTVGAGNHFAEICTVEKIVDPQAAEGLQIREDDRFLLGMTTLIFFSCTQIAWCSSHRIPWLGGIYFSPTDGF